MTEAGALACGEAQPMRPPDQLITLLQELHNERRLTRETLGLPCNADEGCLVFEGRCWGVRCYACNTIVKARLKQSPHGQHKNHWNVDNFRRHCQGSRHEKNSTQRDTGGTRQEGTPCGHAILESDALELPFAWIKKVCRRRGSHRLNKKVHQPCTNSVNIPPPTM